VSKIGYYFFVMQEAHYKGECLEKCVLCKNEENISEDKVTE